MPGPALTMGLTLSPGLPTSLLAQAWGLEPWAPFPGLSTRLVSSWMLGSPFRPPSLLPRLLKAAAAPLPSHLLPPLSGPSSNFTISPLPHCTMEKGGRGWESTGLSGIWRGGAGFQPQNPKETDKPSLSSLAQPGGTGKGELPSRDQHRPNPLEPKPLPLLDPMVEATM